MTYWGVLCVISGDQPKRQWLKPGAVPSKFKWKQQKGGRGAGFRRELRALARDQERHEQSFDDEEGSLDQVILLICSTREMSSVRLQFSNVFVFDNSKTID